MAHLTILDKSKHTLTARTEWVLGRSPSCDIQIADTQVSRQHARVYWHQNQLHLVDLNSRNGTFLNGKQVRSTSIALKDNDLINLGSTKIRVSLEPDWTPKTTDPGFGKVLEEDSTNICHQKMLVTVLVVDIRNYCQLTQELKEETLARIISRWCFFTGSCANLNNSFATKAIGDSVMAVWLHEDNTTGLAQDIQKVLSTLLEVTDFSAKLRKEYGLRDDQFDFGAGINTGWAMVGNNGSGDYQDFTPLGDSVNAAARYESSTRTVGCDILIGESTAQYLGFRQQMTIHQLQLKGYNKPHVLYSLSRQQLREFVNVTELKNP